MWQEGSWNVVSYDTLHPFWADFFDHTFGDRRGWYLVVNGSTSPAGSVWSQTVEVTPGTEYRLGAWFASVYPTSPAWIEFRIDGIRVGDIFSLAAATGVWSEHSVSFSSQCRTSITVEIWDTSGLAQGNDYAVDDVSLIEVRPRSAGADLNCDGEVNSKDLGALLSAWGEPGPTDLDGSGATDSGDLGVLLSAWTGWVEG
jgi:hypothetical protein